MTDEEFDTWIGRILDAQTLPELATLERELVDVVAEPRVRRTLLITLMQKRQVLFAGS